MQYFRVLIPSWKQLRKSKILRIFWFCSILPHFQTNKILLQKLSCHFVPLTALNNCAKFQRESNEKIFRESCHRWSNGRMEGTFITSFSKVKLITKHSNCPCGSLFLFVVYSFQQLLFSTWGRFRYICNAEMGNPLV